MGNYGITTHTNSDFETAVVMGREALATQGFKVITEIDMQATLKAKLDVDTDSYIIMGFCNPSFVHQILQADPDVGLLLPCNVTVRDTAEGTLVSVIDPRVLARLGGPAMEPLAQEVEHRLRAALASLPGARLSPEEGDWDEGHDVGPSEAVDTGNET